MTLRAAEFVQTNTVFGEMFSRFVEQVIKEGNAAQVLRQRLAAVAAAVLEVAADRLLLADGAFSAAGKRITLVELAALLHYRQHELPPGVSADATAVAVSVPLKPFLAANSVQASLVELDSGSGFITLLRHWVVEDCGRVINPLLADEQLRGGVVQGLGAAFYEECRYDARG